MDGSKIFDYGRPFYYKLMVRRLTYILVVVAAVWLSVVMQQCSRPMAHDNPFAQWAGKPYNDYRKPFKDSLAAWGMFDIHELVLYDTANMRGKIAMMRAMPATADCQWQLEADMFEANLDFPYFHGDSTLYVERMMNILQTARNCGNTVFEVRVLGRLVQYAYDWRYLLKCVEYANQVEDAIGRANANGDPNDPDPDVLLYTFGLAEIYMAYNITTRAEQLFNKIIESPIVGTHKMHYIYLHSLNNLALIQRDHYHNLGRSDTLLLQIEQFQQRLPRLVSPHLWTPIVEGSLGRNQMLRHNYAQAATMLQSAVDSLTAYCDWGYISNRAPQLAQCCLYMGQQQRALDYIIMADSCSRLINGAEAVPNPDLYIAQNRYYTFVGQYDKACQYLDSLLLESERARTFFNAEQFLQTEKVAADNKIANEHNRSQLNYYRFLGALIMAVLVAIFGVTCALLYWQKRKAYRNLVNKELQLATDRSNRRLLSSVHTEEKCGISELEDQLCDIIKSYLEQNESYLNPDINLDMLAHEIGTNRSYVSNAVNRMAPNFNALINDYRIKAALRILRTDSTKSIEELSVAVGFNNRRTFYNAFKAITGLSPAVFKNNM